MIETEDFGGMHFEEDSILQDGLVQEACDSDGGGWGSFLLGGVVGAIAGAGANANADPVEISQIYGSFSPEEKIFLRQIWRFEEELEQALKEDNVEQTVLLLNGFVACMNGLWKKFLPGNEAYLPTPKFASEFEALVSPILSKCTEVADSGLIRRLSPEQIARVDGREMSLDPDNWTFESK